MSTSIFDPNFLVIPLGFIDTILIFLYYECLMHPCVIFDSYFLMNGKAWEFHLSQLGGTSDCDANHGARMQLS